MHRLALDLLGGAGYFVALTATIGAALALSWRPKGEADRQRLLRPAAASLLGIFVLWASLSALFGLGDVPARLWAAPFDRLLAATAVVGLGWSVVGAPGDRRWRAVLAGALATTVAVYAGWAPLWAREVQRGAGLVGDPTGLAGPFDLWQAALTCGVLFILLRRGRSAPAWAVIALALLLVGGLLNALPAMAEATFAVGTRLGAMAAAITLSLAAGTSLGRRDVAFSGFASALAWPAPWPWRDRAAPAREREPAGPDLGLDVGADPVVSHMLRSARESGGARTAFAALLTPAGEFDLWLAASGRAEPERLGARRLDAFPTLQSALGESRAVVTPADAPDIAGLVGARGGRSAGGILLLRLGTERPCGVLGVTRARGSWEPRDRARLAAIGRRAAASLEHIAAERDAVLEASRAARTVEAHGAALTRLSRSVDDLAARVERIEGEAEPEPEPRLGERVARYEGVLDRFPWGLVVADRDGQVAFANAPASRLLGQSGAVVGLTLDALFPDPEAVAAALQELAASPSQRRELRFRGPDVRLELETMRDGGGTVTGIAAVVHPLAEAPPETDMLPAVAEALRAPIASLLGYSDLLARGGGVGSEQLDRFLRRIDANLLRMQVMLGNLGAILDLEAATPEAVLGPVDLERAARRAVERARAQMDEKSLAVSVEWAAEAGDVAAEASAVDMILDNLLVLAAQRSPQGGDIRVAAEDRTDGSGRRVVVLSVRDRGPNPVADAGPVVDLADVREPSVALRLVRILADRQGGGAWIQAAPSEAAVCVRFVGWSDAGGAAPTTRPTAPT